MQARSHHYGLAARAVPLFEPICIEIRCVPYHFLVESQPCRTILKFVATGLLYTGFFKKSNATLGKFYKMQNHMKQQDILN